MQLTKLSVPANQRRQNPLLISMIEPLEARQLLSATNIFAQINSPATGAYTPAQIRNAYGVAALSAANEGQGVTIGIVDELDDPNIISDANAFSSEYNLPKLDGVGGDPTMTVYKDTALGSVGSASGTMDAEETSLDVQWAHAMAPRANILLVEVPSSDNSANTFNALLHGVQVAAQMGAQSISLSYGDTESDIGASAVASLNSTYLTTGAAASMSVSVSTGDGSTPLFPATSPNVTAVGGTSLFLASVKGTYSFETAWGGLTGAGAGGGGISSSFATPSFQSNNGVNYGARAIPDVSLDADPVTGVSFYDSFDYGSNPWSSVGGTSLSTPLFAGIVALAQQNRIAAALPVLNSVQINQEMYSLYNSPSYSTHFHDVTQGSNKDVTGAGKTVVAGYSASAGYDLATGLGSPIASTLVPVLSTLASPAVATVGGLHKITFIGAFNGALTLVPVALSPDSGATTIVEINFEALPAISPVQTTGTSSPLAGAAPLPTIAPARSTEAIDNSVSAGSVASPVRDPLMTMAFPL